jgi:pyridoxal phosphate enzyme (YggS family)
MIKDNIERVKQRVVAACARIGADPEKILIVCVAKGRMPQEIAEIIGLGYKDIAENKVQETLETYRKVSGARWHMIGHLQSNKVKEAVKIFDLIHSVDSIGLAKEINKQAVKIGKIQDVLLEVKTSLEETKFGFVPDETTDASVEIDKLSNIRVMGLMTIAPFTTDIEKIRRCFSRLRQLRDKLNPGWFLSMGMSDDFEIAIEEGADIIRIGRAIFNG